MKRIRIGNDIRVQTTLHELKDFDATMIKQLRCYFIPNIEEAANPFPQTYDPEQYTICNCGKPKYNVFPCNIDAPHWFPGYNGFGVNSTPFIRFEKEYLAPSRLLAEQNKIEAYFPAVDQKLLSEYRVVIVLTLYQAGWGTDNLRTYTIDKGIVFALTSDDRDIDTDTIIDLDVPYVTSITVPKVLKLEDQSIFELHHPDWDDVPYTITLHYSNNTEREVTPDEFDDLFIAVVHRQSNDAISINKNGSINRDKYKDIDSEITYILKDDTSINATMSVVSVGKWYKIKYTANNETVPSVITIDGPNEIFVGDDQKNADDEYLASFSAGRTPGATAPITILGASGTGCTVKKIRNNYEIHSPITQDNIVINISYEEEQG